jgi:hypothetical protein
MANVREVTEEMLREWGEWVASRPEKVREAIERWRLKPWVLYRIPSGHRVTIYSLSEPEDASLPVTATVLVTGEFNFVAFERRVFGVDPATLEECDLPSPGEALGSADLSLEEARWFSAELAARRPS